MALTADQQSQLDFQNAMNASNAQVQLELEQLRQTNILAAEAKRAKLEAIRLAKETLIENRRNQPVDAREVTAADITTFANTLVSYINS